MPKRKSKYNIILKEFTKINNKLPEDKKISIKDRRRIVKEQILPQFQNTSASGLRKRPIRAAINSAYSSIPPKEICDLNYIDVASEYAYVEWFALDETISELVPDCVYVKVTAGQFGETRIFNTRNYEYGRAGVRMIVETIRPEAENTSGRYVFSGYQKLRPRKRNNGNPENYYLDFVLFEIDTRGNQTPMGSTESTRFEVAKTRENRKKKTKIKNIIEGKIKSLKQKRDKRKRAKKTLDKNIGSFSKQVKKLSKSKNQEQARATAREQFLKSLELLEKYKKEGKITEKQYKAAFDKLFREFNQ
jgi:hypothetical protein